MDLGFIYPIGEADWMDQRLQMLNLVKPATHDPFSSSFRILSYQLRTMKLRVVSDESLFWRADEGTPSWPHLESVSVVFRPASPSRAWYFEGWCDVDAGLNEGSEVDDSSYPPLECTGEDGNADCEVDWDFDFGSHQCIRSIPSEACRQNVSAVS